MKKRKVQEDKSGAERGGGEKKTTPVGNFPSAALADRLNPNRASFDPELKKKWATFGKVKKKELLKKDRQRRETLLARSKVAYAFEPNPDDHAETSLQAHRDICKVLEKLAGALGRSPAELAVYDPIFVRGARSATWRVWA